MVQIPYPEFRFEHPFSIMVVGPTASGKTFFVMQLLKSNQMKDFYIEWYYNQHQQSYNDFRDRVGCTRVTFKAGLPKYGENDLKGIDSKKKRIIVLDDLMNEAKDSKLVSKLFTQGRHKNASVILILQNAFPKGKVNTDISRNASYITLFKTPSDQEMISKLGQRIFTVHNHTFMDIYRKETDRPHGYVLIDLKQATNQITHKVVASVFGPGECVRYAIDTFST